LFPLPLPPLWYAGAAADTQAYWAAIFIWYGGLSAVATVVAAAAIAAAADTQM
jgi:hypothetical protein